MPKYKVGDIFDYITFATQITLEVIEVNLTHYKYKVVLTNDPLFKIGGIMEDKHETLEKDPHINFIGHKMIFKPNPCVDFVPVTVKINDVPPKSCTHEWKHYVGIIDVYDYCVKCDVKRS